MDRRESQYHWACRFVGHLRLINRICERDLFGLGADPRASSVEGLQTVTGPGRAALEREEVPDDFRDLRPEGETAAGGERR